MRISHAHRRHEEFPAVQKDRNAFPCITQGTGNLLPVKNRSPHVHRCLPYPAILHAKVDGLESRVRLKLQIFLLHQSALIDVPADAPGSVAAHFSSGPVGIVHDHPHIRRFAGGNQHQAVTAHAKVPVRDAHGQFLRLFHFFREKADIDIIVSEPFHFGKMHIRVLPGPNVGFF